MKQKKFNPLIDDLPETVEVNGYEYTINTDFRYVLKYFDLIKSDEENETKFYLGLTLFYGRKARKEDVQGLIDKLDWFINKGERVEKDDSREKTFDLLEDSGKVFSAFYQIYKINLRKVRMHWWTFLELFEGLPNGTHLSEVIEIRVKPFDKNMSAKERNALAKAKDFYRLGEAVDPMEILSAAVRSISNG